MAARRTSPAQATRRARYVAGPSLDLRLTLDTTGAEQMLVNLRSDAELPLVQRLLEVFDGAVAVSLCRVERDGRRALALRLAEQRPVTWLGADLLEVAPAHRAAAA
ncbi:hypothetical protein QE364_003262 [Nocardioides zeae]|uniref:Uncharacterized protein n=2 Tax=Nocardioides zeae TaxID=1457234 RepID=A0AAJ1U6X8_9ACTN|nr:hypothetical protein [Nocardioides zeae]MDQ1106408.1 hypothetical protein [Nocardioides zeae]MDR6173906.1 hypothetical protein [Nocardioides zeae]MDR6211538.1 hypothetical protein [Nocardioides zeae]